MVQRLSYDAWGKRRYPNGADDVTGSIASETTRGFTGEEELSIGGLVHLNGRVYDPLLARMTSADPTVTDSMNPQGWNRYSYVGNDPLAFTDPNGYSWLSNFFHSVANALGSIPILRSIVQIAVTAILSQIPFIGPIVAAAAGAAIVNGLSGGNLGTMLRSAAMAASTAFAFNIVGGATNAFAGANPGLNGAHGIPTFGSEADAVNIAGHALVGCGSSVAAGGSCGSGALPSFAGSALRGQSFEVRLVANTVLGGTGSVIGGGKFANGAVTGAFGYLYNEMGKPGYDYENHCLSDGQACVYPLIALNPIAWARSLIVAGARAISGVDSILADSDLVSSKSNLQMYSRPGGFQTAVDDFHALRPDNIRPINNPAQSGGMVGDLSGGQTAIVRPNSSGGWPTLEIQKPVGPDIKIRYQ